jgi:ABC-type enterobactin transport system permease subunit
LVLGLIPVVSVLSTLAIHVSVVPWAILPSLIAVFLVGVRTGDWRWAAWSAAGVAPAVVLGGALLVIAMVPPLGRPEPLGLGSGAAYAIMMGSVVFGAAVVASVLHALAAIAGVWWADRRGHDERGQRGLVPTATASPVVVPTLAAAVSNSASRGSVERVGTR